MFGKVRVLVILVLELSEDLSIPNKGAGVKPGFREHCRLVQWRAHNVGGAALAKMFEALRVKLFDHAEAPELSLSMVVIAVMIAILVYEIEIADCVARLDLAQAMYREGKFCNPRLPRFLILQIKLGR